MSFVTSLRRRLHQAQSPDEGFTLIELLVTILLASGIVAGLMYLAVETLQSDQRESDRTETQRDMQLALTFIESELRQAVFVYNADCLTAEPGCPDENPWGLDLPGDMTPVLAFWRLQPFPPNVRDACEDGSADAIPCLSGNSYALVVYSIGTQGPGAGLEDLKGEAGIFRSEMSVTTPDGDGYVSPFSSASAEFGAWPPDGEAPEFSDPTLLVDYVDSGTGSLAAEDEPSCPTPDDFYELTPSADVGAPRSFYACVSDPDVATATAGNQDVVLYLRGNAVGRSGLQRNDTFLPPIESRVFIRGTLDKLPG